MTDLHQRIAALSPGQRALLEERLAELATARGWRPGARIAPRDRSRPTPLAIQQQREWTLSQIQSTYNIPGAFRVEGELDHELLGRVLTEVVERHEGLRSTVELQPDGTPAQVVHPTTPVPVPVVDLSHLTADEVSVGLLVQEFAALYVGARLEPLEIQFGDFAAWQRSVEKERIADEVQHWRATLADIPAGLALPSDRPYPARPTFAGAAHHTLFPAAASTELRRFGERESASPGIILIAAAAVLLYRYTGRQDI